MATLAEIDLLARDTDFKNRVYSAMYARAEAILAETSRSFEGPPAHTLSWSGMLARVNLARAVKAAPISQSEPFVRTCANNTTINSSAITGGAVTPYATLDNDINYVVNEKWNEIAGA